MSDDLHPIQIARIREMTLGERLGRGLKFLSNAREFIAAGVRMRHPDWSEAQALAEARRLMQGGGN
jgi:hypothetical protein